MIQERLRHKVKLKRYGVKAALMLGLLSVVSSCVMPGAAHHNRVMSGSSVTILLDGPTPFNPAIDPATMPAPGAEQIVDAALEAQLTAQTLTPAVYQPGSAALSFSLAGRSSTDMLRASLCLTSAIYYEAANEPDDGQRGVAQVILNRARHPAYPSTVCGVVYQGTERNDTLCQFTFGCDGSMARIPTAAGWARARRVAQAALAGYVFAPVGLATHYHTLAVAPSWRTSLTPTGIFGAHIFYKMPGGAGESKAFRTRYFGGEPTPAPKPKLYVPPAPVIFAGLDLATISLPQAGATPATETRTTPATSAPTPIRSVAADRRYVPGTLPESDILPEYRNSGQWIGR